MKLHPIVYGKLDGNYYLTTYKIGAYTLRSLSEDGTFQSDTISLNTKLKFNPCILIRNPKKRFYSGLVQASYDIRYRHHLPYDIYQSSFFSRLLNEHWDDIMYDPNLSPYHEFVYKFSNINKLDTLDIEDWHPIGQTQEMRHTNSKRYLEIDKVFTENKLNFETLKKINNYLDKETYYYNFCKNKRESFLI